MTSKGIRLYQNLRHVLPHFTEEELYYLVDALGDELARRSMAAAVEARALACALLVPARVEHRAIFSADCGAPDA